MPTASTPPLRLISKFNDVAKTLYADNPSWLTRLREEALQEFLKEGIPTVKNEEWKYTNIKALSEKTFEIDANKSFKASDQLKAYLAGDEIRIVFVNDVFSKELSLLQGLPAGIKVTTLKEAFKSHPNQLQNFLNEKSNPKETPFPLLNLATFSDGVLIEVAPKAIFEKVIHIVHVTTGNKSIFSAPRTIIDSGKSSEISVLESHVCFDQTNNYFSCPVTNIHLDENATVHYIKAQAEKPHAYHINFTLVKQARSSVYDGLTVTTGGAMTRNNLNVILNGEGADSKLNGLYSIYGEQQTDNHTFVAHNVPNCLSNQLYKGILNQSSHGVFNGKIYVHPIAQKTNSYQLNKTLLLGEKSKIDTKPQLEIFADDVKCTHGAAIGQLNQEELFYLQSRCISKAQAMKMLARGFAADLINLVTNENTRSKLNQLLEPSFSEL